MLTAFPKLPPFLSLAMVSPASCCPAGKHVLHVVLRCAFCQELSRAQKPLHTGSERRQDVPSLGRVPSSLRHRRPVAETNEGPWKQTRAVTPHLTRRQVWF